MTNTKTMIDALRILSNDIQSGDGVANLCISEAADMIEYLQEQLNLSAKIIIEQNEALMQGGDAC